MENSLCYNGSRDVFHIRHVSRWLYKPPGCPVAYFTLKAWLVHFRAYIHSCPKMKFCDYVWCFTILSPVKILNGSSANSQDRPQATLSVGDQFAGTLQPASASLFVHHADCSRLAPRSLRLCLLCAYCQPRQFNTLAPSWLQCLSFACRFTWEIIATSA